VNDTVRKEKKLKTVNLKKDMIWNTAGSLTYAACIAALAFLVMRIAGEEDGGIFGFGFSTFGQQMFIVAYFGIRPFQITDVQGEYSFDVYRKTRWLTVLLAVGIAFGYLGILALTGTYTARKAVIIFLLALYKIADGFADVYESECQRAGFLWRGGRELCLRSILGAAVLVGALFITKDLVAASLAAVLAQVIVIFFFARRVRPEFQPIGTFPLDRKQPTGTLIEPTGNVPPDRKQSTGNVPPDRNAASGTVKQLISTTALLCISVFLDFIVFSGAKYAIDLKLDDASSGIFNILFMPTSVIYLVANFIIKPFLTLMAEDLAAGNTESFAKTRKKIAWIIIGLTAFACLCAALLGRWALGIFEWILGDAYTGKLTGYSGEFLLIILGGGIYALADLYYYILVMRRKQKRIFAVYVVATALTLAAAGCFVQTMGLTGAAVIYTALMTVLLFGLKLGEVLSS